MHVCHVCQKFHRVIRLFACYTKKLSIWPKNNKDKAYFNTKSFPIYIITSTKARALQRYKRKMLRNLKNN